MRAAIQVDRLRKSYGSHVVLNGLNFCVRQGEIFALLGVNGAGKTTALECIEGLRKFDEGSIVINGQMGIQLQSASLPAHIRPLEAVKMFAKWNRTVPDKAMLDALGICEFAKKQYFQLSAGQKRRLHLALALTRHPYILFLDEPTAGLDPKGRDEILDQVALLHKEKHITVVLVSHSMEDVARYVERIIVMNKGQVMFDDTPQQVFQHYRELESVGLAAPQVTYLMHDLKEKGWNVDPQATTVEEAAESIFAALHKKA